jgi:hypothetical protein
MQLVLFRRLCVGGADVDERVAARPGNRAPRLFGRKPQLLPVDVVSGITPVPPLTSSSSKSNTASLTGAADRPRSRPLQGDRVQ